MKSSLNITAPHRYKHLDSKPKKYQLQEDRFTEIERENRLLLEKMTTIMTAKPQNSLLRSFHNRNNFAPNSGKSNRSRHSFSQSSQHSNRSLSSHSNKSLNYVKRKRDHDKIENENISILKRLRDRKATYNAVQWERDNQKRQQRLFNIAEFPRPLELPQIQVNQCKIQIFIQAVKGKKGQMKLKIVNKKSTNLMMFNSSKPNLKSRQIPVNRYNKLSMDHPPVYKRHQKRYRSTGNPNYAIRQSEFLNSSLNQPMTSLNDSDFFKSRDGGTSLTKRAAKIRFPSTTKNDLRPLNLTARTQSSLPSSEQLRFQYTAEVNIKRVQDQQPLMELEEKSQKYNVTIKLINRKNTQMLIKAMLQDGSGDYFDIVIDGKDKVQNMIKHFNYSYKLITEHLRIMNNRMILINPQAVKKDTISTTRDNSNNHAQTMDHIDFTNTSTDQQQMD
ncbi:UNKNOWN [Stylonychia lemnae]|uniref:Uncharacterized protein n=1 Tax=Stylonychia lemnae TaxID=5949 RepID=A0A078ASW5_STYLE|nr:UNKNOWN [Stylonychia lemnae]|eukprot:CDW83918.1 UNKNOWN [Stylonychia lemnae]